MLWQSVLPTLSNVLNPPLMLFNATEAIFQLNHGENKTIVKCELFFFFVWFAFALDQQAGLDLYSGSTLELLSAVRHVDLDTLFRL